MPVSFPFEITRVEDRLNKDILKKFHGIRTGYVQVGPKKYFFPDKYALHADKYYNFKLRQDDIWIVTYPRTGTTVTSEMIWIINNDHDYERSQKEDLSHRFPFLDFNMLQDEELMKEVKELNKDNKEVMSQIKFIETPGYEILDSLPSPRHIKTHIPLSLLPPQLVNTCKVVYTARNPKDVCESYFHHNRLFKFQDFQGDFESYWNCFKEDLLTYSPFYSHIQEGWEVRNHPNVFFLFYEDFVKDMAGTIRKMAKFLEKPLTTDQVHNLVNHLQIDNFRDKVQFLIPSIPGITNMSLSNFVRKGKTGDNDLFYNGHLKEAEKWTNEHSIRTGVKFPALT